MSRRMSMSGGAPLKRNNSMAFSQDIASSRRSTLTPSHSMSSFSAAQHRGGGGGGGSDDEDEGGPSLSSSQPNFSSNSDYSALAAKYRKTGSTSGGMSSSGHMPRGGGGRGGGGMRGGMPGGRGGLAAHKRSYSEASLATILSLDLEKDDDEDPDAAQAKPRLTMEGAPETVTPSMVSPGTVQLSYQNACLFWPTENVTKSNLKKRFGITSPILIQTNPPADGKLKPQGIDGHFKVEPNHCYAVLDKKSDVLVPASSQKEKIITWLTLDRFTYQEKIAAFSLKPVDDVRKIEIFRFMKDMTFKYEERRGMPGTSEENMRVVLALSGTYKIGKKCGKVRLKWEKPEKRIKGRAEDKPRERIKMYPYLEIGDGSLRCPFNSDFVFK